MVSWKKNLVFVWLSQFLSIMGFVFALPFVPYYMQELGVTDPLKLKAWIALFTAVAPISMGIFSPIWGFVADRYGRRLMLLRANLGAAVFLSLMGMVDSVAMLLVIRTFQGVLTGTFTAAQAMVASHTPDHRSGFAMGVLTSGVYSGAAAGAFCGGFFADLFGYRNAFFVASGLLVLAAVLVLFGTREDFVRPDRPNPGGHQRPQSGLSKLSMVLPLLVLIGLMAFLRSFDMAFLSLLVQDIHGSVQGASRWAGSLFAVASVMGLFAGIVFGHLSDRVSPMGLVKLAALCGGLLMVPQGLANGFPSLFVLRAGMAFCLGGMGPVFQSWLAKTSPREDRGFLFGWAATARAIGWGLAPLLSGLVASGSRFGVRAIFPVGGGLLILFAFAMPRIAAAVRKI